MVCLECGRVGEFVPGRARLMSPRPLFPNARERINDLSPYPETTYVENQASRARARGNNT